MYLNGPQIPNGSAQAPIEIPPSQTVIGINFGNSFASIAVLTKVRIVLSLPYTPLLSPFFLFYYYFWNFWNDLDVFFARFAGGSGGMYRERGWRTADRLRDLVSWRGNGKFSPLPTHHHSRAMKMI